MEPRRLVDSAADLWLGARCPACGRPGLGVCPTCQHALVSHPAFRVRRDRSGFPLTTAMGEYSGALRRLLLQAKERQGLGLIPLLGALLGLAVLEIVSAVRRVTLVPVPSRPDAVRQRRLDLVASLAGRVRRRFRANGIEVVNSRCLRPVRRMRDQGGLGLQARWLNMQGGFALTRSPPSGPLVIVDDICTTGATLCEARRVLEAGGGQVLGAAVVASTARRNG